MWKARAGVGGTDGGSVGVDLVAGGDQVRGAGWSGELSVTAAGAEGVLVHVPDLESTSREILAEENIEAIVDGLEAVVANKDDRIETFEDHADLISGVPAVVTVGRSVRSVETDSTTIRHGFEKALAVGTKRTVLVLAEVVARGRHVEIGSLDVALSETLEG